MGTRYDRGRAVVAGAGRPGRAGTLGVRVPTPTLGRGWHSVNLSASSRFRHTPGSELSPRPWGGITASKAAWGTFIGEMGNMGGRGRGRRGRSAGEVVLEFADAQAPTVDLVEQGRDVAHEVRPEVHQHDVPGRELAGAGRRHAA